MTTVPGESFTKNGKRFTVQFVENNTVYGVMYKDDAPVYDDSEYHGEYPPGYLDNYRISIEDFELAVADAVKTERKPGSQPDHL